MSKWSFLFFFLIFELGSIVCAVAPSSVVFIIGRAIAGCGVSGLMNGGLTIVAGSVPLEKRPQLTGILLGRTSRLRSSCEENMIADILMQSRNSDSSLDR
jgi:predicted MFS family arabinose efflux permease